MERTRAPAAPEATGNLTEAIPLQAPPPLDLRQGPLQVSSVRMCGPFKRTTANAS